MGSEYANAKSELNDPIDQKKRPLSPIKRKRKNLRMMKLLEMDIDLLIHLNMVCLQLAVLVLVLIDSLCSLQIHQIFVMLSYFLI